MNPIREFIQKYGVITVGSVLASLALYSCYRNIELPILKLIIIGETNIANKFIVLKSPEGVPVDGISLSAAQEAGMTILTYGRFLCDLWNLAAWLIIAWLSIHLFRILAKRIDAKESGD